MKSAYTSVPKGDFFSSPRKRNMLDVVLKESHNQVIFYCNFCTDVHDFNMTCVYNQKCFVS